ncbi:uncharacterized protein V6R79_014860 [Siganus canaliculatus]
MAARGKLLLEAISVFPLPDVWLISLPDLRNFADDMTPVVTAVSRSEHNFTRLLFT